MDWLKKCLPCGGEPAYRNLTSRGIWYMYCLDCRRASRWRTSVKDAEKEWNAQNDTPTTEGE